MNGIKCCKDCKIRFIGCHSKCLKYIYEKQKLDVQNAKQNKTKGYFNETVRTIDFSEKSKYHH